MIEACNATNSASKTHSADRPRVDLRSSVMSVSKIAYTKPKVMN